MSISTSTTALRWGRDLVFHLAGLVMGVVAITVWAAGVATSMGMAITYFGLLVALGTLLAFRWIARLERRRAGLVLGAPIAERYPPPSSGRWTSRLHELLGDRATWRDFFYALLAGTVGLALSATAIGLWVGVLGLVAMPVWYWSIPGGVDLGLVQIDTLAAAFAATAAGLPAIAVTGPLVRAMTIAQVALMRAMLAPRGDGPAPGVEVAAAQPARSPGLEPSLPLHVALALLCGLVVTIVWIATGGGYFWPIWVWLSVGLCIALDVIVLRTQAAEPGPERWVRFHGELSGAIAALLVCIWLITGLGIFWPFWPALGLSVPLALHALIVFRDRLPLRAREQALVQRVDVLTRTRQGALDVQAAELRRIERDLHDGAQARLVALTMHLGRAEEKLADHPDAAALVRRAREDAGAAIAELRDLARGIAPPILADRGLAAAIEALGRRSAIAVTVDADPDRRPLPVIETAAYFVVAEALTNVAKHARGASAHVQVNLSGEALVIEVVDSGPGGADPAGGGLTGLRHRVEALDGTLTVVSPPGGGTTVRAEMPCGS